MSELRALMPHPEARACRDAVDAHARAAKAPGDDRPIGMLRAGAAADLILRPWQDRPAVTAHLTVLTPLDALTPARFLASGAPRPAAFTPPGTPPGTPAPVGEVDGEPITAAHLRELLTQLDASCPGGLQAPAGGSLDIAITDATGALLAVTGRTELARLVRRGCPDHPDTACGCPLLGPPAAVDRYRPSAAQYRFLEVRDRTCRHPGCSVRAGWADLDHVIAHAAGGATACQNLLPVPPAPPAQDLRPGLAAHHDPRRRAHRHHTLRRDPDQPSARLPRAHRTTGTTAAATGPGGRPATLLTRPSGREHLGQPGRGGRADDIGVLLERVVTGHRVHRRARAAGEHGGDVGGCPECVPLALDHHHRQPDAGQLAGAALLRPARVEVGGIVATPSGS
ncbi:hypothetical protein QOZ86_14300, partial [Blastococcus capsensis]|nr:hypothetical protein [Blastococcus capsensis]